MEPFENNGCGCVGGFVNVNGKGFVFPFISVNLNAGNVDSGNVSAVAAVGRNVFDRGSYGYFAGIGKFACCCGDGCLAVFNSGYNAVFINGCNGFIGGLPGYNFVRAGRSKGYFEFFGAAFIDFGGFVDGNSFKSNGVDIEKNNVVEGCAYFFENKNSELILFGNAEFSHVLFAYRGFKIIIGNKIFFCLIAVRSVKTHAAETGTPVLVAHNMGSVKSVSRMGAGHVGFAALDIAFFITRKGYFIDVSDFKGFAAKLDGFYAGHFGIDIIAVVIGRFFDDVFFRSYGYNAFRGNRTCGCGDGCGAGFYGNNVAAFGNGCNVFIAGSENNFVGGIGRFNSCGKKIVCAAFLKGEFGFIKSDGGCGNNKTESFKVGFVKAYRSVFTGSICKNKIREIFFKGNFRFAVAGNFKVCDKKNAVHGGVGSSCRGNNTFVLVEFKGKVSYVCKVGIKEFFAVFFDYIESGEFDRGIVPIELEGNCAEAFVAGKSCGNGKFIADRKGFGIGGKGDFRAGNFFGIFEAESIFFCIIAVVFYVIVSVFNHGFYVKGNCITAAYFFISKVFAAHIVSSGFFFIADPAAGNFSAVSGNVVAAECDFNGFGSCGNGCDPTGCGITGHSPFGIFKNFAFFEGSRFGDLNNFEIGGDFRRKSGHGEHSHNHKNGKKH